MGRWRRVVYLLVVLAVAAVGLTIVSVRLASPLSTPHADATPGSRVVPPPGVSAWSGMTWQILGVERVPVDLGVGQRVADAISWQGGIVAATIEFDHDRIRTHLWRSTDDHDWLEVTDGPPFEQLSQPTLLAIDGRLLLLGRHEPIDILASHDPGERFGVAFESTDGDHWTEITDPGSPYLKYNTFPVVDGDGTLLALEGVDWMRRSIDGGATWTRSAVSDLVGDGYIADVAWFGGRWIASGVAGKEPTPPTGAPYGSGTIWTSPDGVSWTRQAVDVPNMLLSELAVGANGIVARGFGTGSLIVYSDVIWTSADGSTWVTLPFDTNDVSVIGDGTRLVMIDQPLDQLPRLRESFDGLNWHDVPLSWADAPVAADPWRLGSLHHFPGQLAPKVLQPSGLWSVFDDQLPGEDPDRWGAIVRAIGIAQPADGAASSSSPGQWPR